MISRCLIESIMRAPVLIIGAHRSGTTATARALEMLGLQLGQRLDSHREPKALQELHEHYLKQHGAAWHNPAPFLESMRDPDAERNCAEYLRAHIEHNFAAIFGYRNNPRGHWRQARLKLGAAWGWKEPRTTLFASAWLQLFPQARILHVMRHPLTVAISIRQRELEFRAQDDPPINGLDDLDYCLRLALAYIEAGERLARRTSHYRLVRFEDIQANPTKTLEDLGQFCGLRFSRARLIKSASSIRPKGPSTSHEVANELLSRYPQVAKLGYEWKDGPSR